MQLPLVVGAAQYVYCAADTHKPAATMAGAHVTGADAACMTPPVHATSVAIDHDAMSAGGAALVVAVAEPVAEPVAERVAELVAEDEHEGTAASPAVRQPAHGQASGAAVPAGQ